MKSRVMIFLIAVMFTVPIAKVTDSDWASQMKFDAKFGHSCDIPFLAEPFLKAHPEYKWQEPYLKDFPSYPWTIFKSKDYSSMIDMIHMKYMKSKK